MKTYLRLALASMALMAAAPAAAYEVYDDCAPFESFEDDRCGGFFFEADWLYWRPRQEGLDFAFTTQSTTTTEISVVPPVFVSANTQSIRARDPHFDWRSGVRLGLGYDFGGCNHWDLAAYWTNYHGHAHGHFNEPTSETLGRWNLRYNVFDFVAGKKFIPCHNVHIKLYGGFKAAKIRQNLRVESVAEAFTTSVDGVTALTGISAAEQRGHSKFCGLGPEIGVFGEWLFCNGFGVFGDFSAAVLCGKVRNHANTNIVSVSFSPVVTSAFLSSLELHDKNRVYQPVIDFSLGISWQKDFCCACRNFTTIFRLSWEHTQWFDHGQIVDRNDLSLSGLTFSGILEF